MVSDPVEQLEPGRRSQIWTVRRDDASVTTTSTACFMIDNETCVCRIAHCLTIWIKLPDISSLRTSRLYKDFTSKPTNLFQTWRAQTGDVMEKEQIKHQIMLTPHDSFSEHFSPNSYEHHLAAVSCSNYVVPSSNRFIRLD
ncbi:hypothetical protein EG68_04067 [Paragonimus skrjabini miyazakii]|uniref:Uncharacterized protein n=1 Tax=Paragonimus skrjabini miyazakii TaxID=59628 RepID=A0A8S9YYL3_9TREM|nr:hypothetical protein EG68_04067 [Paragonimus skrjabini miyazakii]